MNIETAPCSQIQDAAIIGLQYSKTSMLYARQLKSIIDIYSLSPFFHLLHMIFCIFSHEAMFQIFRSIRHKSPPFRYGRPPFRCPWRYPISPLDSRRDACGGVCSAPRLSASPTRRNTAVCTTSYSAHKERFEFVVHFSSPV